MIRSSTSSPAILKLSRILLARQDRLAALHDVGAHHQVRRAAADVDAGDAQARRRRDLGPVPSDQLHQRPGVALQPLRHLVVQPDDLRRRRLVEVRQHARRVDRADPAQHVPRQHHGALGAGAQDMLLRHWHARRHRHQQAAQVPRLVGVPPLRAGAGRVHLAQRL